MQCGSTVGLHHASIRYVRTGAALWKRRRFAGGDLVIVDWATLKPDMTSFGRLTSALRNVSGAVLPQAGDGEIGARAAVVVALGGSP